MLTGSGDAFAAIERSALLPTMTTTVSLAVPPWPSFTVRVIVCEPSGNVGEMNAPVRVPKGPVQRKRQDVAIRIARGRAVELHDRTDRVQEFDGLIGAGIRNRRPVRARPDEDADRAAVRRDVARERGEDDDAAIAADGRLQARAVCRGAERVPADQDGRNAAGFIGHAVAVGIAIVDEHVLEIGRQVVVRHEVVGAGFERDQASVAADRRVQRARARRRPCRQGLLAGAAHVDACDGAASADRRRKCRSPRWYRLEPSTLSGFRRPRSGRRR